MKSTTILLIFVGIFLQLSAQDKSAENLPKDLNEAYSSLSMHDRQVIENTGAKAYQVADITIKSSPGKGVVIGVDKDGDKEFDEFLGLESENNYKLNKAFKAEVIFLRNLIILRPIKRRKKSYVFALNDFHKAEQLLDLLPKSHTAKAKNYFGYGLSYHNGKYSFEKFLND